MDTPTGADMPVTIEFAERLKELPPYLFVEIDKAKREAVAQGRDVVNLGKFRGTRTCFRESGKIND